MSKKYTIYALADPNDPSKVRYIGETTKNLANRKEIRQMLDGGYTMEDIGTYFGVSAGLICMIKSGKRYAS